MGTMEMARPATDDKYHLNDELRFYADNHEDSDTINGWLYYNFARNVNLIPHLRDHRDYVEKNDHGYGDRAFYYQWKLLVEQMPTDFKFLEIGVYMGQIISLIKLLGDRLKKNRKSSVLPP